MPVTLTRTDYRLDETVTVGRLEFPAPAGYSVVVYDQFDVVDRVNIRPTADPIPVEDWRWGRFPAVNYDANPAAVTLDNLIGPSTLLGERGQDIPTIVGRRWWPPLAGVFPERAQVVLSRAGFADVVATVTGFAPLMFVPDRELLPAARPTIEPGVGARWQEPFAGGQFMPWEDTYAAGTAPLGFVYCHPTLEGDGLEAILAGVGAPTADQRVGLRDPDNLARQPSFADRKRIFVQRLSDETSIVRNSDVDGADRSYSERRLELVARVAVAQGMGMMLGGVAGLFFVETAERLGRTGFHRFTVVRRFFQDTI